jgi:hypothetical protein
MTRQSTLKRPARSSGPQNQASTPSQSRPAQDASRTPVASATSNGSAGASRAGTEGTATQQRAGNRSQTPLFIRSPSRASSPAITRSQGQNNVRDSDVESFRSRSRSRSLASSRSSGREKELQLQLEKTTEELNAISQVSF